MLMALDFTMELREPVRSQKLWVQEWRWQAQSVFFPHVYSKFSLEDDGHSLTEAVINFFKDRGPKLLVQQDGVSLVNEEVGCSG